MAVSAEYDEILAGRRRVLLGLGAMFLAACSGSAKQSAASSSGSSGPNTTSTTTSTTAATSTTVSIPPDQLIPNDVLADDADTYNGTWNATFTHDDGTSGPVAIVAAIDPPSRAATITITIGADAYNPGSAPLTESRTLRLDDFAWEQTDYASSTKLFGEATMQRLDIGSGDIEIHGSKIPDHPGIESVVIKGTRLNFVEPHPFTYEINRADGSTTTGQLTFDKS